jgi:hypothetical protein
MLLAAQLKVKHTAPNGSVLWSLHIHGRVCTIQSTLQKFPSKNRASLRPFAKVYSTSTQHKQQQQQQQQQLLQLYA